MKKLMSISLISSLLLIITPATSFATEVSQITVTLNGEVINCETHVSPATIV